MRLLPQDLVAAGSGPLLDYVLEPYAGVRAGVHSVSVLRWFLRQNRWMELWPILERCQELLGPDQTVWGIKDVPGVELYFYNHGGDHMTVERLAEGFRGLVDIPVPDLGDQRYLMCSLELGAQTLATRASEGFRIYVAGRTEDHAPDGTSYLCRSDGLELENFYWFYPPSQLARVIGHLKRSVHVGAVRSVLERNALDCHTVCFANKRHTDALYYSRLSLQQTRAMLEARWPGPVAELFRDDGDAFQELRWDVGYDLHRRGQQAKVGLYGFW